MLICKASALVRIVTVAAPIFVVGCTQQLESEFQKEREEVIEQEQEALEEEAKQNQAATEQEIEADESGEAPELTDDTVKPPIPEPQGDSAIDGSSAIDDKPEDGSESTAGE